MLSPYLFIICVEGLSSVIRRAESRGDLHGVKIYRGASIIYHLLFVDDSFLFLQANDRECAALKKILEDYERVSGQAINLQKSEIFFSRNVSDTQRASIVSKLGVSSCLGTGKYLGLPSMIGRSR